MRIAALFGSLDLSGGNYVFIEHLSGLASRGWQVTVAVESRLERPPVWHPAFSDVTIRTYDELRNDRFDVAVASWWATAFNLFKINAGAYSYFVQSIESRLFPEGDPSLRRLVDASYSLDLPVITEAAWIKRFLETEYGRDAIQVRNGVRKDLYTPDGPALAPRGDTTRLRVLVEGDPSSSFKRVEESLALCRKSGCAETWLMTPRDLPADHPARSMADRVISSLPIAETAPVYRSCDLILKLSTVEGMFGPPLEMFHCGAPAVVHPVTGADEYIRDGENAVVIPFGDDEAVVRTLIELNADRARLARLAAGAAETARAWPAWPESAACFDAAISTIIERTKRERVKVETRASLERKTRFILGWKTEHALAEASVRETGAETDRLFRELHRIDNELRVTRDDRDAVHHRLHEEQLARRESLLEIVHLRAEIERLRERVERLRNPLAWPGVIVRKVARLFTGSRPAEAS